MGKMSINVVKRSNHEVLISFRVKSQAEKIVGAVVVVAAAAAGEVEIMCKKSLTCFS